MSVRILHGDCRPLLRDMDAETFHSCVTDPPYHLTSMVKRLSATSSADVEKNFSKVIPGQATNPFRAIATGFMGKTWDGGDVAFRPETWAEVLRVMKPGAFMAAFSSTRTYHRMVCAIEDAGFIIHPMCGWLLGAGFPKATRFKDMPELDGWRYGLQALKPAFEPICLAQKPMIGTGPENWRAHGCGGLHVDACRVETDDALGGGAQKRVAIEGKHEGWSRPWMHNADAVSAHAARVNSNVEKAESLGRWPPNLLHDGSDEVLAAFGVFGEKTSGAMSREVEGYQGEGVTGFLRGRSGPQNQRSDTGTAARFFPALPFTQDELRFMYSGKASKDDRAGSAHPTVKPLSVMKWLAKLITPPGGHILDPFAGSGTTGEAARLLGFDCTLIEQDASHVADIKRRLGRASGNDTPLFAEVHP